MSAKTTFFNTIPNGNEVTILLYGDIGSGRGVDSGSVVAELAALSTQYQRIIVRINSNGGDVFAGMAIYNALRISTADISISIDGVAASMAAIIALCGKPLYMSTFAKMMLHSVSAGTYGNAGELRRMADLVETLEDDLAKMIAGRVGLGVEEIRTKYFDGKDHWLTATECQQMKLVDGVFDLDGKPENPPQTVEEIYTYFNNRLNAQPQKTTTMGLLEKINAIPQFANKSEAEVVEEIKTLANQATKVEALEKANQSYKEKLEAEQEKADAATLNQAKSEGKITEEQIPVFKNLLKTDRENTLKLLAATKPQNKGGRAADVYGGASSGASNLLEMSWEQLDKANLLATLKASNPDAFKAKFKAHFGEEWND